MHQRARLYLIAAVFSVLVTIVSSFGLIFLENFPNKGTLIQKNGQVFGGDFVTFYVAGKIYSEQREVLYDLPRQKKIREQFLSEHGVSDFPELPFVYPILVAALLSLYAKLSFIPAFLAWSFTCFVVSSSLFVIVLKELGIFSPRRIPLIILASFGFAPYGLNTIIGGHLSAFGLAIFSAVFLALNRGNVWLAGMVFSLSFYKPPIFFLAFVGLLFTQPICFIGGFSIGAIIILFLTLLVGGGSGLVAYVTTASRYLYGQEILPGVQLPPNQGAGIFGALVQLMPSVMVSAIVLVIVSLFVLVVVVSASGRSQKMTRFSHYFALLCTASVGLSVQCIRYDLAILLLPFAILLAKQSSLQRWYQGATLSLMISFYLEFCFRDIPLLSGSFNLSSFLFFPLMALLGLLAGGYGFSSPVEAYDAP